MAFRNSVWMFACFVLSACTSETAQAPLDEDALGQAQRPYGFYGTLQSASIAPGWFQRLAIVKDFDTGLCRFASRRCSRATACTVADTVERTGSCVVSGTKLVMTSDGRGEPVVTVGFAFAGDSILLEEGARIVGTLARENNRLIPSELSRLAGLGTDAVRDGLDGTVRGYFVREYLAEAHPSDRSRPVLQSAQARTLDAAMQTALKAGVSTRIELNSGVNEISRATIGPPKKLVTVFSNAMGVPVAAAHWWIQDGCDRGDRSRRNRYATEPEATGDDCESGDVQWQLNAYFSISNGTPRLIGSDPYEWSGY